MKKILSIIFSSAFLMTSAYAGGMIGIKGGFGELDGTRTEDSKFGKQSASVDHEYGAIFAEIELANNISVGVEYIPMQAIIDTKSSSNVDSHAIIENHTTIYALKRFGDTFYAKAGFSQADAEVKANYTTTTINDHDDTVDGPMVGIGAQLESPIPFLDVVRLEATYTKYNEMEITTTNTTGTADKDTKKGEAEQLTFTIGIAKSF